MKIIECNILIPNKNLDLLKEKLRNLGNRYIENDSKILNISRHKLARAGNAAIALRACKLEPKFNKRHDIIGFECDTEKPINTVLVFKEIASVMDRYGYIVFLDESDDHRKFIYVFDHGCLVLLQYTEEQMKRIRTTKNTGKYKDITYCRECVLFVKGLCTAYKSERDPDDFCSKGEKVTIEDTKEEQNNG